MSRTRLVLAIFSALLLSAAIAPSSPAAPQATAAKNCKKGYSKKKVKGKTKCVKKSKSKATGTGPYKAGQVCALGKQAEYAKYGLVCVDISTPGYPLTILDKK